MKKKIIAIALMAAMALSMAGCGKTTDEGSNIVDKEPNTATTETSSSIATADQAAQGSAKTPEQIQEELDNFAKDADKNVDMGKIDGKKLKGEGEKTKGDLGGYDVEILDAVLVDNEGSKVLVVEYEFKNNTSQEVNFSSVITANAFQDNITLAPAVTFSAEGYEILTIAQNIGNGDKIKVQKAYVVKDDTQPVSVQVTKHGNFGASDVLVKTFDLQ